jgi:hypothetical protein
MGFWGFGVLGKKKVSAYILYNVILQNPVFQAQNEILKLLLQDLITKLFLPENEIIRQNDSGKSMFFLTRDECSVYVTDQTKTEVLSNTLSTSD